MIYIIIREILTILIIILFFSTSFAAAAEPELEEIQSLIAEGKAELALELLNNNNLDGNTDLRFYKALLLSWQEDYQEAEEILIELIESNPQRLDSYN
ncbi:MAG: hypothetical protein ACOCQA_03580 [bacterium]